MMKTAVPSVELAVRARRTFRFRWPLFVALVFNGVLLVRAPLAEALLPDPAPSTRTTANRNRLIASTTTATASTTANTAAPSTLVESTSGNSGDAEPVRNEGQEDQRSGARPLGPLDCTRLNEQLDQWAAQLEICPGRLALAVPWQAWDVLAESWTAAVRKQAGTTGGPAAASTGTSDGSKDARLPVERDELRLHNPNHTAGIVHLLVDKTRLSLPPGATYSVRGQGSWTIQFHRGDAWGNAMYVYGPGKYEFEVSDRGWSLVPASLPSADSTGDGPRISPAP